MINNNDDQACYDRIVLWIVSLVLRRIGLKKKSWFSIANTLQSLTHNINTSCEISIEKTFQTTLSFQRSGQGNSSGPTI